MKRNYVNVWIIATIFLMLFAPLGSNPVVNINANAEPIQSISLVKSGLIASDPLNNETKTQQELQADQRYWHYGGSADEINAPRAFHKDTQGLHIGVQAPSNGTYAGYYAVTPDHNAQLFHAVITTPVRTIPSTNNFFQNGIYVQTTQPYINYVSCVSVTSTSGTVWTVGHTYSSPFTSLVLEQLWIDTSPNQPLTRECTIITNGDNYLKVYLDGVMVYSSNTLKLVMPPPFNFFLEPQNSYAGEMLFGTYTDYYTTSVENIQITKNPFNARTVKLVSPSGVVLADAPVNSTAIVDVGKYHFPLVANIQVYDSTNTLIASTPSAVNIFGGDVYSVDSSITTYSGRTVGVAIKTPAATQNFADTGQLPPQGGVIDATLLDIQTQSAQLDVFHSVTMGFDNVAKSEAATGDVTLLPGSSNQITADFVEADSQADCTGTIGSSEITDLRVSGQLVSVSGQPNQIITIPGGTLVINEQIVSSTGGTNSITVNAVHLKLSTSEEVIVSSVHSDITCGTALATIKDFMTGKGFITVNNGKGKFGFEAGYEPDENVLSGELKYTDRDGGIRLKSTSITSYSGSENTRTFSGEAMINGVPGYTFTVKATDNGKPGKGNDVFSIQISNGYSASGVLGSGNIKLHK